MYAFAVYIVYLSSHFHHLIKYKRIKIVEHFKTERFTGEHSFFASMKVSQLSQESSCWLEDPSIKPTSASHRR